MNTAILFQVPLPTGDVWVQFPLVAVIVACFAIAGGGIFYFTRWIWGEYKKERDKDLAWRESQNKAREDAVAEQNRLWREAMAERDLRYEQYDKERQGTLAQLAASKDQARSWHRAVDYRDRRKDRRRDDILNNSPGH